MRNIKPLVLRVAYVYPETVIGADGMVYSRIYFEGAEIAITLPPALTNAALTTTTSPPRGVLP